MKNIPILNSFYKLALFVVAAGLTFASCDSTSTDSSNQTPVALQFRSVNKTADSASFKVQADNDQPVDNTIEIEGSNGTLVINEVHFIVDEFELERSEGECTDDPENGKDDVCEDFESEMFFVDLPLDNQPLEIVQSPIQNGIYDEIEFEVDDLDIDDDDNGEKQQQKEALLDEIQETFPDWPESSSMVVKGHFVSNSGQTTEYTTFAEAEIEMEMELNPPLDIQNGPRRSITINISPTDWFKRNDGSVINLSNYDYETTQKILEFEVEMENGFFSAEVDED